MISSEITDLLQDSSIPWNHCSTSASLFGTTIIFWFIMEGLKLQFAAQRSVLCFLLLSEIQLFFVCNWKCLCFLWCLNTYDVDTFSGKEHNFNNFMVFLFQMVMKSGGITIQRGKHAQSRKAKQVQYQTPQNCFGPHQSSNPQIKLS